MQKRWYRSRLCCLSLAGIILFLSAWVTPLITKEGRHISASWIAPGDFYQGYGINLSFHRVGFWVGRPYAGLGNPGRATWSSNVSIPYQKERHSWSERKVIPIYFEWGSPSADSFSFAIDYWLGIAFCVAVFVSRLILLKRSKRLESN
jgi:hypothetical protein